MFRLEFQMFRLEFQMFRLEFQMFRLEFHMFRLEFQMFRLEFQMFRLEFQMFRLEFQMFRLEFQMFRLEFKLPMLTGLVWNIHSGLFKNLVYILVNLVPYDKYFVLFQLNSFSKRHPHLYKNFSGSTIEYVILTRFKLSPRVIYLIY